MYDFKEIKWEITRKTVSKSLSKLQLKTCLKLSGKVQSKFYLQLLQDGHSVMVDVATGGSSQSQEQLPMVLKVPHFNDRSFGICTLSYSLLGFGDILVPGKMKKLCSLMFCCCYFLLSAIVKKYFGFSLRYAVMQNMHIGSGYI